MELRILVIEDNESVCEMIEMFFQKEGLNGEFVHDGLEGYQRFRSGAWDLLIVDWMLPGMDGVSLCRKVRSDGSDIPIIMLTAKDSESDQVLGLEMGADDYVVKPFSPLALMARIKAVARRYKKPHLEVLDKNLLKTEHFTIDRNTREVFLDGEQVLNLTPKEFEVLYFFVQHPRQVFTREQVLERVWGYEFYGDERTVDVHVKRLRTKIGTKVKPFLHTVWGVGYKFDETVSLDEN